ncbi:hypothetical protein C8Q77DRAFT_1082805 [Trametes polyzona]|nr:hypothetical protein C8Q77DRAFT_1082805 [Trametes polyzona]
MRPSDIRRRVVRRSSVKPPSSSPVLEELVQRSLVDIADEVRQLRKENARLKGSEERLLERLRQLESDAPLLRRDRAAFGGPLRDFTAQRVRRIVGELPYEILLRIFKSARAPRHELDPAVLQGYHSEWLADLRFRKNFIYVCKSWAGPAMDLLYEDIVLRRMGQIIALTNTLTSRHTWRKNLAQRVKIIRMDDCLVLWPCADAVCEALTTIFTLCTSLRVFEYHPAKHFPTVSSLPIGEAIGAFNPAWFVDDSSESFQRVFMERLSGLTVLDLAVPLSCQQAVHLHRALASATSLRKLQLSSIKISENDRQVLERLPILDFPHLTELYIPDDNLPFQDHVSTRWRMPILDRLTTIRTMHFPGKLLEAHGSHLTYLNLHPPTLGPECKTFSDEELCEALRFCPLLRHVAATMSYYDSLSFIECTKFLVRTPLHLDVWLFPDSRLAWDRSVPSSPCYLENPNVHVRRLYYHGVTDLPTICDPDTPADDSEMFVVRVPNHRFVHERLCVLWDTTFHKEDLRFPPSKLYDYEPDDTVYGSEDSAFEPSSEDSDEDSDQGTDADEPSDSGDMEVDVDAQGTEDAQARNDAAATTADVAQAAVPDGAEDNEAMIVDEEVGAGRTDEADDDSVSEPDADYWGPEDGQLDAGTILEMFRAAKSVCV